MAKEINMRKKIKYFNTIIIIIFYYFTYYERFMKIKVNYLCNYKEHKLDKYTLIYNYKVDKINLISCYVTEFKYNFSIKYNIIKIEYNIGFFDINGKILLPSTLSLRNKLHILCTINNNLNINSMPNIIKDKFFNCIEFFNLNEEIDIGIRIFQDKQNNIAIPLNFFKDKYIDFQKLIYKNDNIFSPALINNNYLLLIKDFNNIKKCDNLRLKKSFSSYPHSILKRNVAKQYNTWVFKNIYNHYFCFCRGDNCLAQNIAQTCKYFLYLNIIDNNRYTYKKTDYFFVDFIFSELSSDEVFPIFEKMLANKFPVHYMTEHQEIYKKFNHQNKDLLTIIPVNKKNYIMNGDFLENYLTLFLKLKAVMSANSPNINFKTNLFYNIEYIEYISVGHGISFFKYFLYKNYSTYGSKINDKLLLPNSDKLISVAKKHGWIDKNIIKINLPRWQKYNNNQEYSNIIGKIRTNSILIMFTWRHMKKGKVISPYYFKNILKIIENNALYKELIKNNLILYFSIHHFLNKYLDEIKRKFKNNKIIKIIDTNDISECLSKTNLIVSDFSSIIFDSIYRRKPFIIYIPDANDSKIKNIYKKNYYELIECLKNDTIKFENKFYDVNKVIKKIIYYINTNFRLDLKLKIFYDSFGLKQTNSIDEFINYIKNLK